MRQRYAVIGDDGVVEQTGSCPVADVALQGGDKLSVPAPGHVTDGAYGFDGTAFYALPPKPGHWARWDGAAWVDPRTTLEHVSAAQSDWQAVRRHRNRLLVACDWTQVPDAPLTPTERLAWQQYRQALRDMPEETSDPANPDWPEPPTSEAI